MERIYQLKKTKRKYIDFFKGQKYIHLLYISILRKAKQKHYFRYEETRRNNNTQFQIIKEEKNNNINFIINSKKKLEYLLSQLNIAAINYIYTSQNLGVF